MESLEMMYKGLKDVLENEKKLVSESVMLSFLNIKSNTRLLYLSRSAVSDSVLFGDEEPLLSQGLIQKIDDKYCITAKGIWQFESQKLVEEGKFVEFMQEKFFNCPVAEDTRLTEKEKVILLAMIFARTFSKDSAVDLKLSDRYLNTWKTVLLKAFALLEELGCISKLTEKTLFGGESNVHPVYGTIRHTDYLPKKTSLIFTALGNQDYYLNLVSDGEINKKQLRKLFLMIFERQTPIKMTEADRIATLCTNIASEDAYLCFDHNNPYISYDYDHQIADVLYNLY